MYLLGVPNILPEPDPSRLWLTQQKLSKVPYFLYFQDDNGRTSYVKLLYEFMDYFWKIPIRFSTIGFRLESSMNKARYFYQLLHVSLFQKCRC